MSKELSTSEYECFPAFSLQDPHEHCTHGERACCQHAYETQETSQLSRGLLAGWMTPR